MRNMYAVKCLYQTKFYTKENKLIEDIIPSWEERIILIKASSIEEADAKCEKYAKKYEGDNINTDNHIFKTRLYEILDIFWIFDTNSRTNIEVYSKMFSASEETVRQMLDVEYPIEE